MNKNEIENKFNKLAETWKKETANCKDLQAIVEHSSYQAIVDMGKSVVPYIMAELESELRDWFPALNAILGVNPIPIADIANAEKMRTAWLGWWADNKYTISKD